MRGFLDVMRCSLNRPVRRGRVGGEYLDMKYHFMEGRFCLVSLYGIIYLKQFIPIHKKFREELT
jgi:hypothetical protein